MAVSLELAISAIKAGRKEEGRQLLNLLIQQNPNNEMAWLWMSSVVNTDEQRARCLYHVLSIDPKNALAQRGLQVLGIAVSDSRPVQVPRDSQPIHIPNPTAPSSTENGARRPFLIDPTTVTKELPFVPVKPPFEQTVVKASSDILSLKVDEPDEPTQPENAPAGPPTEPTSDTGAPPGTSTPDREGAAVGLAAVAAGAAAVTTHAQPVKPETEQVKIETPSGSDYVVVYPEMETQVLSEAPVAAEAIQPQAHEMPSSEPEPAPTAEPPDHQTDIQVGEPMADAPPPPAAEPSPAEVASAQTQVMPPLAVAPQQPDNGSNLTDTRELPQISAEPPPAPGSDSQPVQPAAAPQQNGTAIPPGPGVPPQQQNGGVPQNVPLETRPSQPIYVNYPDPNSGMPAYVAQQQSQPMDPAQYGQNPQNQQFHQPGMHSAATMGMPFQQQYHRPPSEPVQVVQTHLGLVSYGGHYPYHSNATIVMPTMTEAEARARLSNSQTIPTASAAAMPLQTIGGWPTQHGLNIDPHAAYPDDEIDESEENDGEINVLALIIFGTLSITALGGLGMLVLLIFATPA
jgi:hypothetical protein